MLGSRRDKDRVIEVTIMSIKKAVAIGTGRRFTHPHAHKAVDDERSKVIKALDKALAQLQREKGIGRLIPEVSSNLGYALPLAQGKRDVAAFPGRIIRVRDSITTIDTPVFGASQHIASIILTVMQHGPSCRSAMNIAYSPSLLKACEKAGFSVLGFDRGKEPQEVTEEEGRSLAWGVENVLKRSGEVPDAIYDEGGWGKEPMIRILGRNPGEVIQKAIKINRSIQ